MRPMSAVARDAGRGTGGHQPRSASRRNTEATVVHCPDLQSRGTAQHDQPGSDGAAQARSRHRGEERLEHDRRGRGAPVRRAAARKQRNVTLPPPAEMFLDTPAPGEGQEVTRKAPEPPPKPAAPTLGPPRLVKTITPRRPWRSPSAAIRAWTDGRLGRQRCRRRRARRHVEAPERGAEAPDHEPLPRRGAGRRCSSRASRRWQNRRRRRPASS